MTRRNHTRDEKIYVTWAAVPGAGGYNLACANTPTSNAPLTSWSWWHCGSVDSGTTTTFTVDEDKRGDITRDLGHDRSYAVAVRAVATDPAQASPWLLSADAHPALPIDGGTMSVSRAAGSVSLWWTPPNHAQGYEIECATRENNVTGAYTRCADVETATVTHGKISVTISSWTAGGTDYTIDDAKMYDLRVRTTNAWGDSAYNFAPLIHPSMVSNLAVTDRRTTGFHATRKEAVAFTTGPNAGGYVLKSVTVPLKKANAETRATNVTLTLYEMAGSADYSRTSAPSSTALANATLSGAAPTATLEWTDTTWTCSGSGCNLQNGKTYFVVATSTDGSPAFEWAYTTTQTVTSLPSDNGWSIGFDHYQNSNNAWASYTSKKITEIVFATVPSLAASNVATTTATLTIGGYSGNWYYKHTNTGATCEGPVSLTTKDLAGLTDGTSYTYSAYSDSTCTTGNKLATAAAFTTLTPTLTASRRRLDDGDTDHRQPHGQLVLQAHQHRRDLRRPGGGGHEHEGPDRPHGGHGLHVQRLQRQYVHHGQPAGNGVGVHHARHRQQPERDPLHHRRGGELLRHSATGRAGVHHRLERGRLYAVQHRHPDRREGRVPNQPAGDAARGVGIKPEHRNDAGHAERRQQSRRPQARIPTPAPAAAAP